MTGPQGTETDTAIPEASGVIPKEDIAANLASIRSRIDAAARRGGHSVDAVRLMAVSKTKPAEAVLAALEAGQLLFGENRVQEAVAKVDTVAAFRGKTGSAPGDLERPEDSGDSTPEWHLIGHLQTNKAKFIPGRFAAVQSLDSPRLAEALEKQMAREAESSQGSSDVPPLEVYLQLNWDGEDTKAGVRNEDALRALLEVVLQAPHLELRGLMAIPSPTLGESATRGLYGTYRALLERLRGEFSLGPRFDQLSLGMSHDFEWAVEEGATLVRVGTAIFGARP